MKMRLLLLLLLTLVGGWQRFQAISFGLPDGFYRPDEEYVVYPAMGFQNDWNPRFAIYPALQMYVQHAALRGQSVVAGEGDDFRGWMRGRTVADSYLSGRAVSASFGTATIPAIYWAAAPAFGPVAALTAAAATTFSTIHVRESKYATTDAAATFWLTLALGAMLRVIIDGRLRWSVLGGALTGLAIATKYPAGSVLAGFAVAHVGARWREGRSLWRVFRDIRPWTTLWCALAVAMAATPYLLIDWERTLRDFEFQRGFVETGVGNHFGGWGWDWFLFKVMPDSFGPELAVAIAIACLAVFLRPRAGTLSLFAFLAVALLGITSSRYAFYRYVMVPLPAFMMLLGIMVGDLHAVTRRHVPQALATAGIFLLVTTLLVPCAIRDYKLNRLLGRRDTRTIARQWIETNIPAGAKIALTDHGTPYGKPQLARRLRYDYVPVREPGSLTRRNVRWVLSDSDTLPFYSRGPTEDEAAWLESHAILRFEVDPNKPGTPEPVFDQADAFYVPLRHASSVKRPGPRIRIWEIPDRQP